MKDRKKRKFHLRKRTKQLIILFCVLFVSITAGLTISSVRKNSLVSNTAYLNRFNISDEDKDNHEAVTDINGETPNEFAAKVKEANQSDTGNESKVIVNAPLGNEEKLADMVKDKNAVSYDSYTVVRFSDDDDNDKSLFINNMKAEKFDYQEDGMVQIAGIGRYPVTSFDKDAVLTASDTPAKDAHDQGKLLVAVIDTGCGTEADSSVNFTTDSDMDNNGHGTAMARIIKDKSEGKAYILSLKAIGDNGEGTISNVTAAVKYAIEQGADIINMSIIAKDSDNMAAFKSVVEDATMRSIKVVAAAGNFSDDVSNYVPANVTGVISVGAVTEDGMIADFSNYGKDLSMSVKGASSTSEATAIVAGYLAGGKKLGNQEDIAGNYTENPKNEKKDTPLIDKDKFKPQGVGFDVNVMDGNTQLGATPNGKYSYVTTPAGQTILTHANGSQGGANGAYFSVVDPWYGEEFTNSDGNPYNPNETALVDYCSPVTADSSKDIQIYCIRPFYGWKIDSIEIVGPGKIITYAPYKGCHPCMKVHAEGGYVTINIYVSRTTTATIHLNSYDSTTGLKGYFNHAEINASQPDSWVDDTHAETWTSTGSWNWWHQPGLTPSSGNGLDGRDVEGFYDSDGIKYFNQDLNAYLESGGTKYWSRDWGNDEASWAEDLKKTGYHGPAGDVYLSARYGYWVNVSTWMKGSEGHTTINGEKYVEIGSGDVPLSDNDGIEYSKKDNPGVIDVVSYSVRYEGGIDGKTRREMDSVSDFCGVIASPDLYVTIDYVTPGYQITQIDYGNYDLIADGTTADPTHGQYIGTYHLHAHYSADVNKSLSKKIPHYSFDVITEKTPDQPVDVNSIYVVRGTDANGNPTSKEVYAYNLQHNPMKYVEGKSNLGNPETNGMITPDVVQKNRPYEKELGTFDVQIGSYKFNGVADFTGYYPYGDTLTLSNPKLPNGYQFLGYDIYSAGKKVQSVTSDTVTAAVGNGELDPYIRVQGVSYNVSFDSNAAGTTGTPNDPQTEMPSGTMKPQTMHYGQLESIQKCGFTWAGHKFLGWSTNPKATKPDTLNVYTVEQPPAKQQNGKAQDPAKDVQLTDGATAFWDFFGKDLGSYAHQDGASITLYAVWEPENTTVKVNPNGGKWNGSASTQSITQKWGSTKNLGTPAAPAYTATVSFDLNFDPTDPNKAENEAKPHSPTPSSVTLKYVFKNWTVNSDGKGYMKGNVYTFQSTNDTVTANYYFQNMTLPTVTRDGYTFLGWYREEGCLHKAGNAGYTEYRPEKNETLYARWRKDTYTYKDTIEVTDTDTKDSNPERSLLIRKTDTYGTVLTQKGFTIGIYKQNALGGLGDKVYELRTGEGLYQGTTLVDGTPDGNGYYELKNPAAGKYVAHEEEAPAGWFMSEDYKFVVAGTSGERVTVELKDSKLTKPPYEDGHEVKKDSYGRAITNAMFELRDNTLNKVIGNYSVKYYEATMSADFPDEMYESLQAGHSYTLTETNPPDGFEKATYSFDVPRTGTNGLKAISILDPVKTAGQLKIKKVDSTDKPLKGAEFQLFMKDEKGTLVPCMMDKASGKWTNAAPSDTVVPMKGSTDDGGTITWMNLPLRASFTGSEPDFCKSYYLVETKAPEGYSLNNKVIEIRLDENAKDKTVTYTVKDGRVTVTLDAGGNGIAWYTGIGVTVLAAALLLAVHAKRKQAE